MKFLITAVFVFMILFGGVLTQSVFAGDRTLTNPSGDTTATNPPGDKTMTNPPPESVVLQNPLDSSISSIPDFFQAIIDILLVFAIPFIVFFIIYAGFLYVTARGNAETISKAHKALLYALIGGVLILGANVLLDVISGTVKDITG
jgi:hypothetical protein